MKQIIGLIVLISLCSATVQGMSLLCPENFQTQLSIDRSSFTCEVFYESYYSEISYINYEFLGNLVEGMTHWKATHLSRDPRSYFSKCDLHEQIIEDAELHNNLICANVDVIWYESQTIAGCARDTACCGCIEPIYAWVPATEVVLTFQNGLELTSRECSASRGCRD